MAITFDDGYRDNLERAAPALASRSMAGTVFVTTRIFDDLRPFWWDAVEHLVLDAEPGAADVLELDLGRRFRFDVEGDEARDRSLQVLARVLWAGADRVRRGALAAISRQMGTRSEPCTCHALLDRGGVAELIRTPGVSVRRPHVDHLRLSVLDEHDQLRQLERSLTDLRSLGAEVRTAAYPFGGHGDWDTRSVRAAKTCGFDLTVTAIGGDVTPLDAAAPCATARGAGLGRAEFARRLDRWFAGLELMS